MIKKCIKYKSSVNQVINPCDQQKCEFPLVCVESITKSEATFKTKHGECMCPDNCEPYFTENSYAMKTLNATLQLLAKMYPTAPLEKPLWTRGPICGTDGKDYANLCELAIIACKERREISVVYEGKCEYKYLKTFR
ncbi:hypothetical protein B4U80_01095 [Leptotrombidium deliense]|uniref:Kazal-like domain-containing protein n=1 Tax=Leptotrombidium deliense TaxID=299467 RepID=A0A443SJE7_9ACAR|nr:hypothetical protein B4U80_01095 [Leptotrombidium deliense]